MSNIKTYLKLLRVDNYLKNLFIFAPLFFDFQFNSAIVLDCFIAFFLFCLLASGVYIFNDIIDLELDRNHPVKQLRPLASNKISIKKGVVVGIVLIIVSLVGTQFLNDNVFLVFLSYLGVNVLYNLFLKKIPVIDVLAISCCFIIRIFTGSYATDIEASNWILIMTFLLSMFLGFSKRRADIILAKNNGNKLNANTKIFTTVIINRILYVFAALICATYIAYSISKEVVIRMGSPYVFLTSIFVVIGVFRYMRLIKSSKKYKDPTATVIDDWKLQSIIFIWIISFIIIKYI